ncbi:ectoine synthase [Glycomyces luteolus]|uniref:L-ectoine synthase n=1 Tax=Glycomyces luteolus TaxID=2670330 RepID=A0A9X3PAU7_9ACTN|nr:ectoine synthase [Glycomyces luteolus]MDA1361642.1 ectoine synthase [Glycomyces luteolus]
MIVRRLEDLIGTEFDVEGHDRDQAQGTWRSRRLLLARDKVGFSLHDTVLFAGTSTTMRYANHVEAVYVIEGSGKLRDLETGDVHALTPGTMYLLNGGERHTLDVEQDLRCVCVFNPPVTGREVHDADGTYPLLTEDD